MFYSVNELPRGLFKACIVPRPIAWVSTISPEGITNLAPFSYFQAISDSPPMIMFVVTSKDKELHPKDTLVNIQKTKEFVVNLVTLDSIEPMKLSSNVLEYNESEMEKYNIASKKSHFVKTPSVKIAPVNLECSLVEIINVPENNTGNKMIIGKILGISVNDDILTDEKLNYEKLRLICRMGYSSYGTIEEI